MLSFVFNKHTYPISDVTICAESAIHFANKFATIVNVQLVYFFMLFQNNEKIPFKVAGTL